MSSAGTGVEGKAVFLVSMSPTEDLRLGWPLISVVLNMIFYNLFISLIQYSLHPTRLIPRFEHRLGDSLALFSDFKSITDASGKATFNSARILAASSPYVVCMGCGAAEATGLGFVCFVVINPCVLLANKVVCGYLYMK